eukprot:6180704-Pleurochrysis_carterae.AAC.5
MQPHSLASLVQSSPLWLERDYFCDWFVPLRIAPGPAQRTCDWLLCSCKGPGMHVSKTLLPRIRLATIFPPPACKQISPGSSCTHA